MLLKCDEPVGLKSIDGHLGKTTRSLVFVRKSYCEIFEIDLECSQYVLFDTLNLNITKLFLGLCNMLLLLPTAAILEISVVSQKRRGKLCDLISIQLINTIRSSTLNRKRQTVLVFFSV